MKSSPTLLAIIGCFLWGTSPLFAQLITLPAGFIILMRSILSCLLLGLFLGLTKTTFKLHSKKDIMLLGFIALLMNAHLVLIYQAIQSSFVAPALIAFYSYPLFSLLFDYLINKRPIKALDTLACLLILVGILIILQNAIQHLQLKEGLLIGILLGVLSGICFAARNVCFKKL